MTRHKAAGEIALDSNCRVNRSEGSHTFEVNTGKKTYYLTADNTHTVEDWVRTLQVRRLRVKHKYLVYVLMPLRV